MTDTAKTRADTRKTQKLLETTEIKILRKISNQTLRCRTSNGEIKMRCWIEEMNWWIENRKIK